LRELLMFQAGTAPVGGAPRGGDHLFSAGVEVAGFQLSARAVERLSQVDLGADTPRAGESILVLDRAELADASRWAAKLQAAALNISYMALPGFPEMISTPHASVVPEHMIKAVREWLKQRVNGSVSTTTPASDAKLPPGARMHIRSRAGVNLTERATFVDAKKKLFAVITELDAESREPDTGTRGVILLNCGATNHIGPNRMHVEIARKWAAAGSVVMRLDIGGLGDSGMETSGTRNQVYPPGALFDISVAIEFLRRRRGVREITLAGVCSGGYHALRSAIAGLPVDKVVVINPLTFYWRHGDTLSDVQISEVVRNPGVYLRNAFSIRHWPKLLMGRVNLWRVVKIMVRRAGLAIDGTCRDWCRKLGIRIVDDLGWDLASVGERGIPIVFIFARGDAGLPLLWSQAGSMVNKLGDLCEIHIIDGADHIFTQREPRMKLMSLMERALFRPE
jgi:hypothetical protein